MMLFSGIFHDLADDIYTLFDTQNTGIQRDIIVLRLAPGTAGVVLIVDTAALILFSQTLFGTLFGFAVAADDSFGAVRDIRENKSMEGIGTVFQNVVSIPTNDDTGTLFSQLQDDTALNVPQEVCGGKAVHNSGNALGSKGIGEQAAAGRMLAVLFHELGGKAGFQGNLFHQFLVIEGDAQSFCHHTANSTAAGTEFTADSNNFLFHNSASFGRMLPFLMLLL